MKRFYELWTVLLLVQFASSQNVETRNSIIISPTNTGDSPFDFGSSVTMRQSGNTNPTLYIGASSYGQTLDNGIKEGGLFVCEVTGTNFGPVTCNGRTSFDLTGGIGTSMTISSDRNDIVVCGSQYFVSCGNERKETGVCYRLNSNAGIPILMTSPCQSGCPGLDLVFLLDASGSVEAPNFQTALRWINTVLLSFRSEIDTFSTQVSLITFSHQVSVAIPFGDRSFTTLSDLVLRTIYTEGGTFTDDGIDLAVNQINANGRDGIPNLLIVLTDGDANNGHEPLLAANNARSEGIILAAVGVGPFIDQRELLDIAGSQTRVFQATDFDNLDSIVSGLNQVIINTGLEGADTNATNELTQCQFGSSAHVSSDFNNLYVGAVGSYDRAGSVAEFFAATAPPSFPSSFSEFLDNDELEIIMRSKRISQLRESYVGYSTTSGSLYGGAIEYIASGSPRYQSRGQVLIYQANQPVSVTNGVAFTPPESLWQLGGYFGHSVLAIDINNDGVDDLLVSAPLYTDTSGYDQGRVFVYMNNITQAPWTASYEPQILIGTNAVGGRFGSAIVDAGDIDLNGYNDIIIGSPGELKTDGSSGVVYLYYVSELGIQESRKQRIVGEEINSALIGFGLSVATRSTDVDGNGYPDVVVSAPSSDSVVILRSRPIVDVTVTITLTPSVVDVIGCLSNPTLPCSTVRSCGRAQHRATGTNLFDMDLNFLLDPEIARSTLKRFVFLGSNTVEMSQQERIGGSFSCVDHQVQLNAGALGRVGSGGALEVPALFQLSFDFIQSHQDTVLSPVIDPVRPNFATEAWSFEKGCEGLDGRCEHDLVASAIYSLPTTDEVLVLRRNPGLFTISINITNLGPDHSYFTKVNITSGQLALNKVVGNCVELSEQDSSLGVTVLEFSQSTSNVLKDLMTSGQTCQFTVEFLLQSLTDNALASEIDINGVIYSNAGGDSVAFDPNKENNIFNYTRPVRYSAVILTSGSANPEFVFYNRSVEPNFATSLVDGILGGVGTNVQHTHTIFNNGPLRVAEAPLTFTWPSAELSTGLPLFYLYDFTCEPFDKCRCSSRNQVNTLNIPATNDSVSQSSTMLTFPDQVNLETTLTCSNTQCEMISCTVDDVTAFLTITVQASFKIWLPTLAQAGLQTIMFSTVDVDTTALPLFPANVVYSKTIETRVNQYTSPPGPVDTSVNAGAIVGAIIGALALLFLVIAVLWKAGFFKSKYAELKRDAQRSVRSQNRGNTASTEVLAQGEYEPPMN